MITQLNVRVSIFVHVVILMGMQPQEQTDPQPKTHVFVRLVVYKLMISQHNVRVSISVHVVIIMGLQQQAPYESQTNVH